MKKYLQNMHVAGFYYKEYTKYSYNSTIKITNLKVDKDTADI